MIHLHFTCTTSTFSGSSTASVLPKCFTELFLLIYLFIYLFIYQILSCIVVKLGLRPATLLKKKTLTQVFFYELREISKKTFSNRTPPVATFIFHATRLFLYHLKILVNQKFSIISGIIEREPCHEMD